jgi:microcystin-dependent protein
MSDPFLGQIALFPYAFAPYGWAPCEGQVVAIAQYQALFNLIGTTYGGNGTTNFALPDLRSRVPIGTGQGSGLSPYKIGAATGVETVTLTPVQNAPHNHSLNATTNSGTTATAGGNQFADPISGSRTSANTGLIYSTARPNATLARIISSAGGDPVLSHNNIQPYQCLSYCIALVGLGPPRD